MNIIQKIADKLGWCVKHNNKPTGVRWRKEDHNYTEVVCTICGKHNWIRGE